MDPNQTPPSQPVAPGSQVITPASPPNPTPPVPPAQGSTPDPVGQPPQQLFASDPSPFKPPSSGKKKWIIMGAIATVVVLILGALFFFLYWWPNQPQNVWKSGINRSGQAVDKLVSNATQAQTLDSFKKSTITVTLDAKAGEATYTGKLDTKFDSTKSDGSLDITASGNGAQDISLGAKFLSEFQGENQFPNVYFQLTGIKSITSLYAPELSKYDGQWISIDENYWKTLNVTAADLNKTKDEEVTSEDIATTAKAIATTTNQYVLTTDPNKAIFEQRQFVGKEKVDDVNAYHYIVGINKDHAKSFCEAIINTASETPVYKKLAASETNADTAKTDAIKSCQDSVDKDLKDTDTFDMWIDTKYKLIYKVRLTEDNKPDNYVDIGQNYKGDNQVALFVNTHNGDSKTDAKFNIQTDLQSHKTTGTFTLTGTNTSNPYDLKLAITAEPYTGDITVTKPTGAIPLEQIMKELGIENKPRTQ